MKMTDDLVKRLRKRQEFEFIDGYKRVEWEDEDALAAADRSEELEEALRRASDRMYEQGCPRYMVDAARAALKGETE